MLKALYEGFLDERRFLKNCSPKTLRSYGQAWDAFESVLNPIQKAENVRSAMKSGVVAMMAAGKLKPSSINVYLRALNAFVRWAGLEGHFDPPIKGLALLKTPTKIISTLNETQVQHIVQFRPKYRKERRVHAMAMMVLDCGLRLNECLQLEVGDIDLANFLVTVRRGKGDKMRKVPISGMGRKVLHRYIAQCGDPARRSPQRGQHRQQRRVVEHKGLLNRSRIIATILLRLSLLAVQHNRRIVEQLLNLSCHALNVSRLTV